jgi:hypothetical protein
VARRQFRVIAIGAHENVLWVVLPFAVLDGAYAPRAISFAAGQAGFTVVLLTLFWASEHLDFLGQLEEHLSREAARVE